MFKIESTRKQGQNIEHGKDASAIGPGSHEAVAYLLRVRGQRVERRQVAHLVLDVCNVDRLQVLQLRSIVLLGGSRGRSTPKQLEKRHGTEISSEHKPLKA